MVATTWEKRPDGFFAVPLNSRCSRKWASPDLPGVSSAEPTLYQSMWVTTGARRSGMTTTSSPLASLKWEIGGPDVGSARASTAKATTVASAARTRIRFFATNGASWTLEDTPHGEARMIGPG